MPDPLVTYPDVERQAVDHLEIDLAGHGCTVGVGVPTTWKSGDNPHVQVGLDGTPSDDHPIAQRPTLRVTVWSDSPTEAKALALLAHGYLLARHQYQRLTGLLVAHDAEHDAELASFTVRANVRSTPITHS